MKETNTKISVDLVYTNPKSQQEHKEKIESFDQLIKRLNWISNEYPSDEYYMGASIYDENENELSIGLAKDEWVIMVSLAPDYLTQYVSIQSTEVDGSVGFYWDQWTPIEKKHLIPKEKASDAIKYWLQKGELSNRMLWTDLTH